MVDRRAGLRPFLPPLAGAVICAAVFVGCAEDDSDMPRGGGYTEPPKEKDPTQPPARSALGKARESAQRLVDEDIAEYNRKLEEAADGTFPK